MNEFRISRNGIELIKSFEGFMPVAYDDVGNKKTIGYGTLIDTEEEEWLLTARIDEATAEKLLVTDLRPMEKIVNQSVKVKINQNQFDALCSFVYNVGARNFTQSSLLREINTNPNSSRIHFQFLRWVHVKGQVIQGLVNRRKKESELYFK